MSTPESPVELPRGLLLAAYTLEREDERQFWSTTSTFLATVATAVLALTLATPTTAWEVWIVTPVVAAFIFSYYIQQGGVGARRRWYMDALEGELSKAESGHEIQLEVEGCPVRILAYNRYSWSLNTNQRQNAAGWPSVRLFQAMNAVPLLLALGVLAASVGRLWRHHLGWGVATLTYGVVMYIVVGLVFMRVLSRKSRKLSWERATSSHFPT